MSGKTLHYTICIEWSDEDQAFLVTLPEWADHVIQPVTHGDTYDEALRNAQEVLELLTEAWEAGEICPPSKILVA